MYYKIKQTLDKDDRKLVVYTLSKFFNGQSMLIYTDNNGFAIFIDKNKAALLDLNLKEVKGIVYPDYQKGLAMTIIDAIFIRHLLKLRTEMLDRAHLKSLDWVLQQCYYIELSNGQRFSLPSLLSKYISSACRDTITLSSGLWKFMWYYKLSFNLSKGELKIINKGTVKDMLQPKFEFNGSIYTKGTTIEC